MGDIRRRFCDWKKLLVSAEIGTRDLPLISMIHLIDGAARVSLPPYAAERIRTHDRRIATSTFIKDSKIPSYWATSNAHKET